MLVNNAKNEKKIKIKNKIKNKNKTYYLPSFVPHVKR